MIQRKFTFAILIPLTLVLGSCGTSMDLKSARDLAKSGDAANTAFQKIANDQYDSCLRVAQYIVLQSSTKEGIDNKRREQEQSCEKDPKTASEDLQNANKVVIKYIQALGSLAANDLTNYDPQLSSIASSLKQLKFNQIQVDAGSEIAKILFRATTDKYRRKQLRTVVISTNDNLKNYIDGFSKAISDKYIHGALETEKVAVDSYYREYLGDILNSESSNDAQGVTAITSLDSQWRSTKKTIIEKQNLGQEYVSLLKKIVQDHNSLEESYSKRKMLSKAQLHQMAESYAKDLNVISEKSNKLFKTIPTK